VAELLLITPSRWTLTEVSCEVRLPSSTVIALGDRRLDPP
jgi:hypothetical protein